jgi:hypothetical protein
MPKRSSKKRRPRDVNQLAKQIVEEATGDEKPEAALPEAQRNPAAVALRRLGGLKGGKARAQNKTGDVMTDKTLKNAKNIKKARASLARMLRIIAPYGKDSSSAPEPRRVWTLSEIGIGVAYLGCVDLDCFCW